MGCVRELVSDPEVKDTPVTRRKIDLTTTFIKKSQRQRNGEEEAETSTAEEPFRYGLQFRATRVEVESPEENIRCEEIVERTILPIAALKIRKLLVDTPRNEWSSTETPLTYFRLFKWIQSIFELLRTSVYHTREISRSDMKTEAGTQIFPDSLNGGYLGNGRCRRLTDSTTNVRAKSSLSATTSILLHLLVLAGVLASCTAVFCPNGCTCDDNTLVVSCVGVNLDVIPITLNPSIQRIVLKENRIKIVDAAAFQFYRDLKNVDLSNNHLFTIPNGSFEAQKQLVELHLKHNKISALTEKTFQGLRSLTVLNLRDNYLETLNNGLFTSLLKLEELDLGQNRISKVEPGAFQKLGTLRVLYLDDNQLRTIPSPALAPLNALAELHIGWNAFSSLPDEAFKGLEQLAVLDIMGAGLDNISDGAFRGLNALRTLKLGGNKLREVPTKQLAVLPRLEELTLGQNFFTTLRSGAFQGLSKLKKLDVSGAKLLTTVERGAFSDNANLETLVLNSNKRLTTMEDGSLAGLPNLRHLMLRDNAFADFSESLVAWNELRRLDLSENPIVCDCSLLWLAEALVPRNSSPVICAEPPEIKGRSIKGMTPDELGCAFSDPRKQALLATLCAAGLALFTGLALIVYYRCRRRVRDALKDYKWKNRAISRKEHEYQKTFSDDEYIVRSAHAHHHHHHHGAQAQPVPTHHHQAHLQQQQLQHQQQQQQQHAQIAAGIKPIPVTEL